MAKGMGGHHRAYVGGTNDWLSTPDLVRALGPFDLDPCASVNQPWTTATTMYTSAEDGFRRDWFGGVWLNPPYGPHTWGWLDRLAEHGNGIALIFARTETAGFHRSVWQKATALYFFAGRLHFHYPITGKRAIANAGAPSVLVAYGDQAAKRFNRILKDWPGAIVYIGRHTDPR